MPYPDLMPLVVDRLKSYYYPHDLVTILLGSRPQFLS